MSGQNADRRENLLDATVALILRGGVRRASVDGIAREAGVSKGAVYLEFPSKTDLVDAAVQREMGRYLDSTAARIAADPEGGRLSGIYRHSIAELLARPFMRAIYEDDGQILAGLIRGPERYRPRVLLGEDFLRTMADAGLVRTDLDPATMSHLLSVLSVGPLLAEPVLRDESAPGLEATFELLAGLVVAGLEPTFRADPAAGVAAFQKLADGAALTFDGERPR
ncbi:TetR/AcrR family transcriptional regulator [Arthrobacter sp. 260]|uniref:TetR/AcrR family transcriptional regulator n=1 Tax=Arthrobacter sp. 260 TaxID=2735314 RepID=UPI001490B630|nr:TetR/AcrR family transcriptional regulator [Arthrobacter sp. 260]NOJ58941.1 TetR/AcrR family transcriptional regulator [Arthrobacter sp. 260]